MAETDETQDVVEEIVPPSEENVLDLKELAQQYQEEYRPRPFSIQLLITLGFILGPIFLLFEVLSDSFMASLGDLALPIFGSITILFFLSVILRAWQESKKYS